MSAAEQYDFEQGPAHPGGSTSVYSRVVVFHHPGCAAGQRPPQVGVPLWMPTQLRPPAVGVASPLDSQPATGGAGRQPPPTRRSVYTVPVVRLWANKRILRKGLPLSCRKSGPPPRART